MILISDQYIFIFRILMCFFCYTSGGRSISKQEAAIAQCSFLIERKAEERRRESKPQESLGWLRRKRVGIPCLDVMKESIECYALISKPTSRADARIGGMPQL